MSPYTKDKLAAIERAKLESGNWTQDDETPAVRSPWLREVDRNVPRETSEPSVLWSVCVAVSYGAIMFLLGWVARGWFA